MGFPAILSALQPFQFCIYKRKYSKLTFSNGSQLMGKRFVAHLPCIIGEYMQKWNFQDFHQMSEPGREGESSCHHVQAKSELKNLNWHPGHSDGGSSSSTYSKLTFSNVSGWGKGGVTNLHASFEAHFPRLPPDFRTRGDPGTQICKVLHSYLLWGYSAILSTLQPFQICIYKGKYSKLTFSNGSQLMGKGLWQISMHHWRVHAKVEFPRFPPDVRTRKGESIIFQHVQAKSELKNFRWHPGQSDWGVNHLSAFHLELRYVSFALISFMGFPTTLSALQPFQICIYRENTVN